MSNTEIEDTGTTTAPAAVDPPQSSSYIRILGTRLDIIIIMGFCFTIIFFTFFLLCARRWDKFITRKFFAKTQRIYLPQHINSFGSSVRSVIVDLPANDPTWNNDGDSDDNGDDLNGDVEEGLTHNLGGDSSSTSAAGNDQVRRNDRSFDCGGGCVFSFVRRPAGECIKPSSHYCKIPSN